MKKTILTILLCGGILFGLTGCGSDEPKEDQPQDQVQDYGTVDEETADVLVAKFNTEVVDNSTLNPASNDYMVLYVEKDSEYASTTNEYMKYLIQANNPDITDSEVNELMELARDSADEGKTVNNGKGIDVGYVDSADNYQYQVIRLYK